MALTKDVNSYATVEEADGYFADRLDVAAWTAADNTAKAQALITATSMLDDMIWTGTAISESQKLSFPRNGSYFDPRLGTSIVLSETVVPDRIIRACYELSYHLLNNDGLLDDTGSVFSLKVGPINLDNVRSPSKIPRHVKTMIAPLLANSGSDTWWRAN